MKHIYVFALNVFVKPGIGKAAVLNAEKVTEMRPIDADTLLKRPIWFCGGWVGDSYAEGYMDALDKVEEVIKSEPTIEMPHWIPCEEKLPKVGEEVLCQCRANIMEVLCLDKYGFWENPSSFRHYLNSFVIAWMPLPRPYEGEREDDD